jgi:anti-anti-sigma factor
MATMTAPRAFYGHLDEALVLVLKGQIRYMTARAVRTFFDGFLLEQGRDAVVVDLRELNFIDSTGMGLLARIGRATLDHGRRSVIVCADPDVLTCLRSASFDTLFIIVEQWPFDHEARVSEVPLENRDLMPDVMERVILEAHRDLASLSEENRLAYAEVVATLEAELNRRSN